MNSYHFMQMGRYKMITHLFQNNPEIFENNPEAASSRDAFLSNLASIEEAYRSQIKSITGHTIGKQQAKSSLLQIMQSVLNLGALMARRNQLPVLHREFSTYLSGISRMRDQMLLTVSENVYQQLTAYTAELNSYGLTEAVMTDLRSKIDDFAGLISSPRIELQRRRLITKRIQDLFIETNGILREQLDKFVRFLQRDNAEFAYAYSLNRRSSYRNRSKPKGKDFFELSGRITDVLSGDAIASAAIQIPELSVGVFSDTDGCFAMEGIPAGTYDILVFKPGYQDAMLPAVDLETASEDLQISLQAIGSSA